MQACGSSGMSFPHRDGKLKTISPKKAESISVTIKELKKNQCFDIYCLPVYPASLTYSAGRLTSEDKT